MHGYSLSDSCVAVRASGSYSRSSTRRVLYIYIYIYIYIQPRPQPAWLRAFSDTSSRLAPFPGPAQLSVAISTEKRGAHVRILKHAPPSCSTRQSRT